jgi:uncharacterized membrane protein YgcG
MSWMFLLVVFMALCVFAVVIGVMVMLFRAASRSSGRPPGDTGASAVPPILPDDGLTNPANPLHHFHHPTTTSDDSSRHFSADPGPSSSAFDNGSSSGGSFDSGSSSGSSDSSGSGCG